MAVTYGIDNGAYGICCTYIMHILAVASASNASGEARTIVASVSDELAESLAPHGAVERPEELSAKTDTSLCDQ